MLYSAFFSVIMMVRKRHKQLHKSTAKHVIEESSEILKPTWNKQQRLRKATIHRELFRVHFAYLRIMSSLVRTGSEIGRNGYGLVQNSNISLSQLQCSSLLLTVLCFTKFWNLSSAGIGVPILEMLEFCSSVESNCQENDILHLVWAGKHDYHQMYSFSISATKNSSHLIIL